MSKNSLMVFFYKIQTYVLEEFQADIWFETNIPIIGNIQILLIL